MLPFSCGRHGNYCHPPCWSALSHSLPPAPHAASAQPASAAPCRARPGPTHAGEWDLGARTQFWSFPARGGHQPGGRRAGSKLQAPLPPAASPKGRCHPAAHFGVGAAASSPAGWQHLCPHSPGIRESQGLGQREPWCPPGLDPCCGHDPCPQPGLPKSPSSLGHCWVWGTLSSARQLERVQEHRGT